MTLLCSGCFDGCSISTLSLQFQYDVKNGGASVQVSGFSVYEGEPLTVTLTGQIGDGKVCPETAVLSYASDSESDFDQRLALVSERIAEIENLPTERVGGACRIKPITRTFAFPAKSGSEFGGRRYRVSGLLVAGSYEYEGDKVTKKPLATPADKGVRVVRKFVIPTGPTGTTGTTGTTGPTGPNTAPKADLVIEKVPLITGSPTFLDARASTDAEGAITRYDFEWDASHAGPEQSGASATANTSNAGAGGSQRIFAVTVFDAKGASNTFAHNAQTVQSTGIEGDFQFTNEGMPPGTSITVKTKDANQAVTANLDKDLDGFDDGSVACPAVPPCSNLDFPPFSFSTPGFKLVAVRYERIAGSNDPQQYTEIYKLIRVGSSASATRLAPRSTAAKTLTVPIALSRAKLVKAGRLSLARGGAVRVRGMLFRGRITGKLPKAATKAQRTALSGVARGVFAAAGSGVLNRLGTRFRVDGTLTVLMRARSDKKTQVCLRITSGPTRGSFSTLGATGKAKGYSASGPLPPLTLDAIDAVKAIGFAPRKGRAKALPAACRALVKSLPK